MTPSQANELIAYLRSGDNKCLLPETCDSPYCRAWKELIAYIRELEADKRRLDYLGADPTSSPSSNPIYYSSFGGWTWGWTEGYYLGDKDFATFREAIDAAMQKDGF